MSIHVPGFQSSFKVFCIILYLVKLATISIRVSLLLSFAKSLTGQNFREVTAVLETLNPYAAGG